MISPSLKRKVAICIFSMIFKKNKRFKIALKEKIHELTEKNQILAIKLTQNKLLHSELKIHLIEKIVSNLTTELAKPEDVIIENFADTTDMYIVAKGEVYVNIVDDKKKR